MIHKIISPNQAAFIRGRQILDGVLIANELIELVKRSGCQMLLFKVDFKKAFDSVCWKFLLNIMEQMGFSDKWRKWITGCLHSATISLLVNGSPTKEFKMERGLRQGDPLSPLLFIIVVEALQVSIFEACNKGVFSGISIDGGPNISLLQYADDALFLGELSSSNLKSLIQVLKCFSDASGLHVNIPKSCVYGVGVDPIEVGNVAALCNCKWDSLPYTHLGLPIDKRMYKLGAWMGIIEHLQK